MKPEFECACDNCAAACHHRPGWFLPGQVEALAERMGMPYGEFYASRVAVDAVETVEFGNIFILMPAIVGVAAGAVLPPGQFGRCTFLTVDDRCEIHDIAKPHECAMATHEGGAAPEEIAAAWLPYQIRQ